MWKGTQKREVGQKKQSSKHFTHLLSLTNLLVLFKKKKKCFLKYISCSVTKYTHIQINLRNTATDIPVLNINNTHSHS